MEWQTTNKYNGIAGFGVLNTARIAHLLSFEAFSCCLVMRYSSSDLHKPSTIHLVQLFRKRRICEVSRRFSLEILWQVAGQLSGGLAEIPDHSRQI